MLFRLYTLRLRINKLRRLCFDSREYSETDKYVMKLTYRDLREYFAIFRWFFIALHFLDSDCLFFYHRYWCTTQNRRHTI